MQYQIQHILSNPALLKEVPDDVLQNWIVQYPYVSLFHLYHLKNKGKYNESDLHKTAFFFNNREKLYYLLNNISFESGVHTHKKTSERKALKDEQVLTHETRELNETIEESVTQLNTPEDTADIESINIQNDNSGAADETQDNNSSVVLINENYLKDKSADENLLNTTLTPANIETQEISTSSKNEAEVTQKNIVEIKKEQPLSIADQILLEIQQLKEERARKEKETITTDKENNSTIQDTQAEINIVSNDTELSKNEFRQDANPELIINQEVETDTDIEQTLKTGSATETEVQEIAKPVKNVLSKQEEQILAKIQSIQEERERQLLEFAASRNSTEESTDHVESDTTTITQIQENIETAMEEVIPEKTLSIQDEVIARIQKIKEEREKQIKEAAIENVILQDKEEDEVQILPQTLDTTSQIQKEDTLVSESAKSEQEADKEQIISIQPETESKLSIQDEIIERIRKIQEDRKLKSAEENTVSEKTDNSLVLHSTEETQTTDESIETSLKDVHLVDSTPLIDETIKEYSEIPAEENIVSNDIRIIEKSDRLLSFIEIDDTKNPLEEILLVSSTNQAEKDIELIESKILEEIKNEIEDVDVLSSIHLPDTKSELKEEIHTTQKFKTEEVQEEANVNLPFDNLYPAPLLVKVDSTELFEKSVSANEINEPVNSTENDTEKNNPKLSVDSISTTDAMYLPKEQIQIPEEYPDEAIDHMSIISKDSGLFIPEIEEDKIEDATESEVISDKQISLKPVFHEPSIDDEILPPKLDEEIIQEPHTFVEWLKILDGNLQIQTSGSIKELDNWIEIPRYEIEQSIAHKKEIEKEEQKLFEPNFEEGEVDLFNEIDEEVSKVASESVQFKQDMMTETLARIYEKQGKKDKALEIYNILLLKFPEKSAYFAGLIEKIEKE